MKIQAYQHSLYRNPYYGEKYMTSPATLSRTENTNNKDIRPTNQNKNLELQNNYYYPTNITFGYAHDKGIKKLVTHGLPCMYTGVEMIDPQKVKQLIKNKTFNCKASTVFKVLKPFEDSLINIEKDVYQLIKTQANKFPDKKVKEVVESLLPDYKKQLVNCQEETFKTLTAYSYSLPSKHKKRFDKFMDITYKKINEQPIVERFSVTQFKYDLGKIKEDIKNLDNRRALSEINRLVQMSEKFKGKTSSKNQAEYVKLISDMEKLIAGFSIKDNTKLQTLIEKSKSRLNKEDVIIPFSRKAFIYDLNKILADLPDENLKSIFDKVAQKLPTSRDNIYAYITKISSEPSEKIMYRLLCPSFASVEHIKPRSCGGNNCMKNYGGATSYINSKRGNIPFEEQLRKVPDTPIHCQNYVDRLIEYANAGIFEKENIDPIYIENFVDTIKQESNGKLILDTSKLYESGKFTKAQFNV